MNKKSQQQEIYDVLRQLLASGEVSTQEDIALAMNKSGFELSQSKISRLLHKIGAIKVNNTQGESCYRLPHEYRLAHELAAPTHHSSYERMVINIEASDALIVIRTIPSAASFVARLVDHHSSDLHVLGTIAGDDTIVVIPKASSLIPTVIAGLKDLLG